MTDWLGSNLPFHVMRDNPYHVTWILGGMWGARMDQGNRDKYLQMLKEVIKAVRLLLTLVIIKQIEVLVTKSQSIDYGL